MAFLCFLLVLCLVVLVLAAGAEVAESAVAPDFGASAAMDAAAKPKVSNAVVIRVADFFMGSPKRWLRLERCEEYDGFAHFSRDEDHFTLSGAALGSGRFFERTCHTRYPTTAALASIIKILPIVGLRNISQPSNGISDAVMIVVNHSAQRFCIHKPTPSTAKTAA